MKVISHKAKFMRRLEQRSATAMRSMVSWLAEELQRDVGGPSPSKPGTPPGVETGAGQFKIGFQIFDSWNAGVGLEGGEVIKIVPKHTVTFPDGRTVTFKKRTKTAEPRVYMLAHDAGTVRNVEQRPWFRDCIERHGDVLAWLYARNFH